MLTGGEMEIEVQKVLRHHLWIVPSEDFRYNRVNMTAFRLVDSTSERVRSLLREMEEISPIGRAILNQSQVSLANAAMGDELFFYRNSHFMHF